MHIMGIVGMPRRYAQFTEYKFLATLHPLVVFVTIAVFVTAAIQLVFLFNFIWSLFKGPKAGDNPWEATTLEWATTSPPPYDNFAGIVPTVYRGPYEFSVPGAPDDFIMQTEPEPEPATARVSTALQEGQGGNGDGDHNGHER
jgi:cytochrome c oxidase subunit 1